MVRSRSPWTSSDVANGQAGRLEARGVAKAFGPVRALADVDLVFESGLVHAVLGENGAGKSTLMSVLAGFLRPDAGSVLFDGAELVCGDPLAARRLGIHLVHQHFMLVPEFTARENIALATMDGLRGRLDTSRLVAGAVAWAEKLGWELPLDVKAAQTPVGVQQRIEILKALALDSRVLILDEPTAVLSQAEIQDLFRVLRQLASEGRTVILIAHKLAEVLSVADRVAVLRLGRKVAEAEASSVDSAQLERWMVGERPALSLAESGSGGELVVSARGLVVVGDRGSRAVDGVDLECRAGEVLGIGGVDGNGQLELAEALAGVRPFASGTLDRPTKTGFVPQDRRHDGLALDLSVEDNMVVGMLGGQALSWGPFLIPSQARASAGRLVEEYAVKVGSPRDPVGSLSGGNQQKVVVSRVLSQKPDLLVVMNPTRGLDVRATDFVHSVLRQAAARGAAVVLFSTDLDELDLVADRQVYMSAGRFSQSIGGTG